MFSVKSRTGQQYYLDVATPIPNTGDVIIVETPDKDVSYTIDLAQLDFVKPTNIVKFAGIAFASLVGAGIFGDANDFLFVAGACVASMVFIQRRLSNAYYTVRYNRNGEQCIILRNNSDDLIMLKNSDSATQYLRCIDNVQEYRSKYQASYM